MNIDLMERLQAEIGTNSQYIHKPNDGWSLCPHCEDECFFVEGVPTDEHRPIELYHGSPVKFNVGDLITSPASRGETTSSMSRFYRPDRVYATTEPRVANNYAQEVSTGEGWIYKVKHFGTLEYDQEALLFSEGLFLPYVYHAESLIVEEVMDVIPF